MSGSSKSSSSTKENISQFRGEEAPKHKSFKHHGLTAQIDSAREIDRDSLINTINRIHFLNQMVLVHLYYPKYEESILTPARPEPCNGNELTCEWLKDYQSSLDIENCQFLNLIIEDGKSIVLVPAEVKSLDGSSLTLQLPETSHAVYRRRAKRFSCRNVSAEIIQHDFLAKGELLDFSPLGFRIRVQPTSSLPFQSFNPEAQVIVILRRGRQMLFSGGCLCIRQGEKAEQSEIVLIPQHDSIQRFRKRHLRNPRQKLLPTPIITFEHPFTQKKVQFEVQDISTSGFSVYEQTDEGILMPGVIIPELTINYAGALKINSSAQVIYRIAEEEKGVRCGLALLDMDIQAYTLLTHILTHALDPHSYISSNVDMDALWEFFFETGFIYPSKYRLVRADWEKFKKTYQRLYQETPEIANHFTYQQNGRIYGHVAMVRAYERSWLIQHHSARGMDGRRVGFTVLRQIMHYLNDIYRMRSSKSDYVMTYYRPEKKVPDRVFGSFTKRMNNLDICSVDTFPYLPYTTLSLGFSLPKGWTLSESSKQDLRELNRYYSFNSGGLLINSMGLLNEDSGGESVEETYARLGFFRKILAYSLKNEGRLSAVFILDQSEPGLNLSDLLNCIRVFVIQTESVSWELLSIAISQMASEYRTDRVPVLFYPFEYVKTHNIPYERLYNLWILNTSYDDEFLEYMQRKFRIGYN